MLKYLSVALVSQLALVGSARSELPLKDKTLELISNLATGTVKRDRSFSYSPNDYLSVKYSGEFVQKDCGGEYKQSRIDVPRLRVSSFVKTDVRGEYIIEVYYERILRWGIVSETFVGVTKGWEYTHYGDGYQVFISFLAPPLSSNLGSDILFAGRCFKKVDGIGAQFKRLPEPKPPKDYSTEYRN